MVINLNVILKAITKTNEEECTAVYHWLNNDEAYIFL